MRSIRMFFSFLTELFSRKSIIYELTKRDFKSVYLGSYLGIIWAFLLPLANVFIFWFVFQVGFRSQPVAHLPYILWYIAGMIIWNFFNDCVNNGMNSVVQNAFVVKKVVFSIGLLPIVKILSALVIHIFFIFFVIIMYLAYGQALGLHSLQILYYLVATFTFVLGLSWLTSSVVIFFRDLRQIIGIFLQFGFFLTPIFWTPQIIPEKYHLYLKLNPVYYLVQGYRDSFVYKVWFWEHPLDTLYFWSVTAVVFVAGAVVFRRLRPHFADVL
jgi:lipopolysaccharide transport system permease protein